MKALTLGLGGLLILLQYPLWLGKGSWLRVWEIDRELTAQIEINNKHKARNAAMDAEVRDLKQGMEAIEERARSELGMIRQDEVFFQIVESGRRPASAPPETSSASPSSR